MVIKVGKRLSILSIAITVLLLPFTAQARDALLEGSQLCTRHLPGFERLHNIPTNLLAAISSNESGRYHKGLKMAVPWPWTINVQGKGFYFDSKEEAMRAVRKYQAQGIQSIDVGCMQVNLYYHGHVFSGLDQAFDPASNVGYAAKFLRTNYDETHSWMTATAYYHSQTPALGSSYYRRIYNRWQEVMARVKGQNFGSVQLASLEMPQPFVPSGNRRSGSVQAQPTVRLNSIRVGKSGGFNPSNKLSRERGVLVIRPQKTPEVAKVEVASDERKGQFNPRKSFVQVGNVTTTPATASAAPKFVFY